MKLAQSHKKELTLRALGVMSAGVEEQHGGAKVVGRGVWVVIWN